MNQSRIQQQSIDWLHQWTKFEVDYVPLDTMEEYNQQLDEIRKSAHEYHYLSEFSSRLEDWEPYRYAYCEKVSSNSVHNIFAKQTTSNNVVHYYRIMAHEFGDISKLPSEEVKSDYWSDGIGTKAEIVTRYLFEELEGVDLRTAFGYCDRSIINNCIPNSVYYYDDTASMVEINNVGIIDVVSMFPSCSMGKMPTMEGAVERKGRQKPTQDYPFCYYLRSGGSAEFGKYDSDEFYSMTYGRKLADSKSMKDIGSHSHPKQIIDDKDELTLMCKASDYQLDDVLMPIYDLKKENKLNPTEPTLMLGTEPKLILNAFIGTLHRSNINNKKLRLDHLAVIIINRAIKKIMAKAREIEVAGGQILQIVVDSVIYRDDKNRNWGQISPKIGEFEQEVRGARYIQRKQNQYIAISNDFRGKINKIKIKHSGLTENINNEINNNSDLVHEIEKWSK